MSLVSFSRGRPQCTSYMRRALTGVNDAWLPSIRPQTRGKKKLVKSTTIKVRLLADLPQFGRKGKIISLTPGRMRNDFYPSGKAEYMTVAQLRATGIQESAMERDSTFRTRQDRVAGRNQSDVDNSNAIKVDQLRPEHAMKIVSEIVPESMYFYRSPIATASPTPPRQSSSVPATSAISAAAKEVAHPQVPPNISIYGSVSTSDIAENLKAILAQGDRGSRVVLKSEDIVFLNQGEEKDRVKHLGTFEIDIKVKGATTSVRRTIIVKAQE